MCMYNWIILLYTWNWHDIGNQLYSNKINQSQNLFLFFARVFIFLGSKITANGDCSHEIKRRLLLGRKVTTNLDSILKSRDVTLPTKVHLV